MFKLNTTNILNYYLGVKKMGEIMRALFLGSALLCAGCATRADNIAASYTSPNTYASYTCAQLKEEAQRVSGRATTAIGAQNSKATNDAIMTGVGAVIFWPTLFFIKGDGASASDVARLKGEMEAIEQASIMKKCGIVFSKPEEPAK